MSNRLQAVREANSKVFGVVHGPVIPDKICQRGEGIYLFDQDNKKYLDFSGGPCVAGIGHGDQRVTRAVTEQMNKVSYFFHNFWLSEPLGELAERLIRLSPPNLTRCQFVDSGSEATETAIKLAHQYHREKGNPEKSVVIGRWQGYHGMTLGALSASGVTGRRRKFEQLLFQWPKIPMPLCYRCPYNLTYPGCRVRCAQALDDLINQVGSQYIAAFIAEPIGGAATAAMVPVPEYYPMIREICTKHDVLFIDDEVICGFGRTGRWFGIEHWGVNPDMITIAKGLTGGYTTMAGVLISDDIRKVFADQDVAFLHGFTMEANPVSCVAATTVIDIIEQEGLVARSARLGEYMHRQAQQKLAQHPSVGDVRGKGMLLGVELVRDSTSKEPFDAALTAAYRLYAIAKQKGCMIYPGGGLIQGIKGDHFLASPPLIITEKEIDTALDILAESITGLEQEMGM